MDRSVHSHQPYRHPHIEHRKATERWNYYKARRKDHTSLIFACIAAGVAAVVGICYLLMSSASEPATRGAENSVTATSTADSPGTATSKGPGGLPADSRDAADPSAESMPPAASGTDAPKPSKILPASFKEDIQGKFDSK